MSDYTVDYFIEKFRVIPEKNWTIGEFTSKDGKCCALGHCGHKITEYTPEGSTLDCMFLEQLGVGVADVNDGTTNEISFLGATPQERILVALEHIRGMNS